ncbi:hypothetical protein CRE_27176 [Caenorhabditis remanei]|uniref:Domain of unknown function DX domain-containing protein n=1 Tax=Caenorhabditis remanei TaxID=31234 RepID=E3LNW1_CAERE|nr:hypothetical protein CRE_27176 [Caenorhabditis remanei]
MSTIPFEESKSTSVQESTDHFKTLPTIPSTVKIAATGFPNNTISSPFSSSHSTVTRPVPVATDDLCIQGISVLPPEKCETLDDCNLRGGKTTQRWCDPVNKSCCRFEKEHELFCPDGNIPLMNEPFCKNFEPEKIWSGTCSLPNGICKHGHCCPSNNTLLPGTAYKTNQDCVTNAPIHKNQTFGYCDPETGKVFIMSEMSFHNQKNKKLNSFCFTGRDCGQSFGMDNVCMRVSNVTLQCYINPKV